MISLLLLLLLVLTNTEPGLTFTVIMSDNPGPPVEGPPSSPSKARDATRTDPKEQEAVYDVMKATGNEWALEIQDVCKGRWHGIECMPDKDNIFHVVSLSFGSLSDDTAFPTCDSARSYISPSITRLRHLKTLFFYRCLTNNPQPVPSFLGELGPTLQTLVLRENGHVGPIPEELGKLTGLTVLDLHKNNLKGSIPASLGGITGLRLFDLSCNRLSGSIPNVSFPSLSVLDLNQNHLKGYIPTSLLASESLLKIDLSRNRVSGPVPQLSGHRDLTLLDLSYNTLSGPLPKSLNSLKSLQALMLNGNAMSSTVIPESTFEGLDSLMILLLSNMNLEGTIPDSLGRLSSLRVLHLDGNQFNGTIPSSFANNLSSLSELRLDNNRLTGLVPFKRERIWKMGRKLRLDNNLGLCYDVTSGLADDLETLSDAGIERCDEQRRGEVTVSVQHVSTDTSKGSTMRRRMIEMVVIFLLCFCLL